MSISCAHSFDPYVKPALVDTHQAFDHHVPVESYSYDTITHLSFPDKEEGK